MLPRKIKADILVSLGCYNKYNRLGALNNKHLFPTLWRLRIPRPFWCLVRALFLVCGQLLSCCVLTWWRERFSRASS